MFKTKEELQVLASSHGLTVSVYRMAGRRRNIPIYRLRDEFGNRHGPLMFWQCVVNECKRLDVIEARCTELLKQPTW